jgi:hypothetical protein
MKKTKYIFILLLLLSTKINAQQQYQSCLDGDIIKWSILTETYDWPQFSIEMTAYGDTAINGTAYKKIMAEELFNFDFEETNTNWRNYIPDLSNGYTHYCVRESDDVSRLYVFDAFENKEDLIADLNLQVGDEFPVPKIWPSDIYREGSLTVDSVYIKNELKHVRFNYTFWVRDLELLDYVEHSLTFIEGIGPNIGLFNIWYGNFCPILNCFQNQSLFYKNELISYPCGYAGQGGSIQTVFSNEEYTLKRERDFIEIDFLLEKDRQISIYDIRGRLYYKGNFFSGKELIIPTALFPKGIYLLKLYSKDNNQVNIHKIIL